MGLPEVALSINQPWAHLVATSVKPIENRNWNTEFRGEFLIHVGLKVDRDCNEALFDGRHPVTGVPLEFAPYSHPFPTGGMIGIAEVVDVIRGAKDLDRFPDLDTSWFVGRYGLVIANARPIDFIPCCGALGFFTPNYELTYVPKPERIPRAPKIAKGARVETPNLDLFA